MELLTQFHFLRPVWLLALIPAMLLFILLLNARFGRSQWQTVIDPELQPYMLDYTPGPKDKQSLWWLLLAWLLSSIALAGPTWQQLPQPVSKNQHALVIMVDMSYSMAAEDVKPSRYQQVNHKVTDILRARQDGLTALVTYSGAAHTVTPLTDDSDTITNLLPSMSPYIMPKPGSRPDLAIELAQQLVRNSNINQAELLLITDGIQTKDIDRIDRVLDSKHFTLSVLAVGTAEGAPIPLPKGGFLKDASGTVVLPQLNTGPIEQLSREAGVRWRPMGLTDNDWKSLISTGPQTFADASPDESADKEQRQFDLWLDQGYWLLLLMLPVALLAFRRGVLFSMTGPAIGLALLLASPQPVYALEWKDLWQTPDQQGAELLQDDPAAASEAFDDPNWKGTAAYRAGQYQQAIEAFGQDQSATGHYNLGNALAQSGQLQAAIEAYDRALALNPELRDAATNRERVQEALNNQQQNNQQQDQQQDSGDSQDGENSDKQQGDDQSQQQNSGDSSEQDESDAQSGGENQQENGSQDPQQSRSEEDRARNSDDTSEENEQQQPSASDENAEQGDENDTRQQQADQEQAEREQQSETESTDQQQGQPDQSLTAEQQTRLKQWLNRVPDQPGKLLERKFLYQYQQQHRQSESQESEDVLW